MWIDNKFTIKHITTTLNIIFTILIGYNLNMHLNLLLHPKVIKINYK